jgi:ubiquinone biosynthesis protein COQ9
MSDHILSDDSFDRMLVTSAFSLAGIKGWRSLSIVEAAREAELSLERARERFPNRAAVLMRFGRLADRAALADAPTEGTVRDRLFDLLMRRIDFHQQHRSGVLAVFQALPAEPQTAVLLKCACRRSMAWMLDAAGVPTGGISGQLRILGMLGVWLWTIRAWQNDEGVDLAATMSALDKALSRADGLAAQFLPGKSRPVDASEPFAEPPTGTESLG